MKKIFFILSAFLLINGLSSCGKRGTTPDNPDVTSRIIDSVSVAPSGNGTREAAVDADSDGTTDFFMSSTNDDDAYGTTLNAQQVLGETNFSTDGTGAAADFGSNSIIDSVSVPKGPGPPRAIWADLAACSFVDAGIIDGFAGAGDFYLGFYLVKPDGKHYGWLKLNIPADGKSIKLISLGYHTKPRTAIKAGEI